MRLISHIAVNTISELDFFLLGFCLGFLMTHHYICMHSLWYSPLHCLSCHVHAIFAESSQWFLYANGSCNKSGSRCFSKVAPVINAPGPSWYIFVTLLLISCSSISAWLSGSLWSTWFWLCRMSHAVFISHFKSLIIQHLLDFHDFLYIFQWTSC